MKRICQLANLAVLVGLAACGGDENLLYACDEVQGYQAVREGKRIDVPDGLDPLNEFAEMPIPRSQDAPPPSQRCIELPPSVRVKTADESSDADESSEADEETD